jgi:hypothetical protein
MRVTCPYCKGEMEEPKDREKLIDEFKELYDQHQLALRSASAARKRTIPCRPK